MQFAKYAETLSQKDRKILAGLVTGHNTLNRHLTSPKIKRRSYVSSSWKRICHQSTPSIGRYSAFTGKWSKQFGNIS